MTLTTVPARERADTKPCKSGCQTIIRAPIQGLAYMIGYCATCKKTYVAVPLKEWDEYVRVSPQKRVVDSRILPFHAG